MNIDLDSPKARQDDPVRPGLSFTEGSAAEKNEFLGSMGHELRNPLANITAQVETLLEGIYGPLESPQKKAVAAIQDSARQLLQLIADVVDLGKIEAGVSVLSETPCLVADKCAGSLAVVAGLAQSRSIQVSSEVVPPELTVFADVNRLQQIMTELLSAAALSMQTGGRLRFRVSYGEGVLQLQTLGGISQPVPEPHHLLKRMGKVKPIGMALLQRLVKLHSGTFEVGEAAGQEVRMTIRLPMVLASATVPVREERLGDEATCREAPPPPLSRQPTILIADDQPALIFVTKNYLESVGFQVITARDGSEAIEQACALLPDLILMDVRMPVVDGLSAIRQIRASADPRTRSIAIVSLSGHASAADKEKCLAAGATAYLNKPFGVRELDRIISDHIRLARG